MKLLRFHLAISLALSLTCIEAKGQLIVDFDMNLLINPTQPADSGCIPDMIIQFIDRSTINGSPLTPITAPFDSHHWDFDYNSNTTNIQSPVYGYFVPGTYCITLTVTQDGVNYDSITKCILVFDPPSPRITASPTTGCDPLTVIFTNNSFSTGSSICNTLIDFGDGAIAIKSGAQALDTFMHTYELIPQQSSWTVTVTITDCRGCDSTKSYPDIVSIDAPPVACFTPIDTVLCSQPFTLSFDDCSQSANTLAYLWDFGDGSTSTLPNPAHTFPILVQPQVDSCYVIDMTVVDTECGDSAFTTGRVCTRLVEACFVTSTPVVCIGANASFNSDCSFGSGLSYSWDFGDGTTSSSPNPSHSYSIAGTYTVSLTVTDSQGCSDIETKVDLINVIPSPTVDFTADPTTDCKAPLDVVFTSTVSPSGGSYSYAWNFGTGDTSTVANPSYTYEDPGPYTPILEVTDLITGCTNTAVKNNYINIEELTVSFIKDPSRGCAPLTVQFTSTSDPAFTIFSWDFGDTLNPPYTSSQRDPQYTFVDTGTYVITFSAATPGFGCTGTVTDTVKVGEPLQPIISIDSNPACVNEEVIFNNLTDISGISDSQNIIWNWDFGSNDKDPPSQYYDEPSPPNDSLDVNLEVCYNGCCADTTLKLVILEPKAEFFDTKSCASPGLVIVTDSSKGANTWEWDFGDGSAPILMPSPRPYQDTLHHTYTLSGAYDITLVVEDTITGCMTEKVKSVDVSVLRVDFDADKYAVCVGEPVSFQNQSSGHSDQRWDFGDGSPINRLANPDHVYDLPGVYSVKLTILNLFGCEDSLTMQDFITVSGVTADFDSPNPSGCIPPSGNSNTITFNDLSFASPGSVINEWHWDFGELPTQDFIGSAPASVTHTYPNAGRYPVSLRVVSNVGCEDTETIPNYADIRKPIACFNLDYQLYCEDQAVYFQSCSEGTNLSYEWNFGDGTPIDTRANPDHIYADTGCYDVSLSIIDDIGCTDATSEDSAVCIGNPTLCIDADDTVSVCPPHLARFTDCSFFSGIPVDSVLWDFGDGSFSRLRNPAHIYVQAGLFEVTLVVWFDNFCTDTLVRTSYISVGGAIGAITAEPDTGCVPLDVVLDANSMGAVSHFWLTPWDQTNTGRIGGDTIHTVIREPGNWQAAVVLTDAQLPEPCSYILFADFDILADTVYADFWFESDTVCREDPIQFRDSSNALIDTMITGLLWDFGDSTFDTVPNPVHAFQDVGLDTVCLTAFNGFNCSSTICKPIFIRDKPTAGFTVSALQGCDTLFVDFLDTSIAGVSAPLDKWFWDYGDTTTVSDTLDVQGPSFYTYRDTGQYLPSLVVTDVDGCDDTAVVAIDIYKTPYGIYNNDTLDLCWGDTIQLSSDSTYEGYVWTPDIALSNDSIANPLAFPLDTIDYYVTITEAHGCDKKDSITVNVVPLPPLTVTPYPDTMICIGDSIQLNAVGGTNHQWQPDFWISATDTFNPMVYPTSSITYIVTNEGVGGCTNTDSVRVIVSTLVANFIGEQSCFGDSTNFIDYSTYTDLPITQWQWVFGDIYNPNPSADTSHQRNPAPIYSRADSFLAQLVIYDAIGCTDTATQIVIIDTPATAMAGFDTTICFGETVQLFSSGGEVVFWTPAPIDSPEVFNPWVTPSSTTIYTAHITNGVCPPELADVVVTVVQPPDIRTIESTTILRGESIELTTTVDRYDSIWWAPFDSLSCVNCLSPIASPDEKITYTVYVIDEFGCTNSVEVTLDVEVRCKEDQIWVANAFMPNSAEFPENRSIKAHLIGLEKMNYFRIYDRWGKLMFETNDVNEVWNGTNIDGVKLNGGVYVFMCEAVCWFKKVIVKTGNITLIK